jgi:hypothetical protein
MERNALLYALAEYALVAHARFKQGGTWSGATDALRRRLCRLVVREDEGDLASRALAALGAVPLASPAGLGAALASAPMQPEFSEEAKAS